MRDEVLQFTIRHSRIAILLAVLALLVLVGAAGEVAAHGPCHANPGSVPDAVCTDLPSQHAPRG